MPRLMIALAVSLMGGEIHLNEIQVIGSHNSYHQAPCPAVMSLIAASGKARAEAIDYTHPALADQFEKLGIRQVELDVFADPDGGRFSHPSARTLLSSLKRDPGPDPNERGVLDKPGLKVLHLPDFDYLSTAPTFTAALRQIRAWSKAHPHHVPILVLVELKDDAIPGLPTQLAPFDAKALDGVDAEIRATFAPSQIFTPDDLRGTSPTLPAAIRDRGWPALDAVRGKVMFALDNEGAIRDHYLDGHPSLKGRAMFATAPSVDHPAAAWFKINDAVRDFEKIRDAVSRGFLVRTRADIDTIDARRNDTTRRDKALSSGAQFVSTDFPVARPEFSPYRVSFPDNAVARSNPVSFPKGPGGDLEAAHAKKP
jgi:Phosphoinositide phospholipase C, Ca2+-dependent